MNVLSALFSMLLVGCGLGSGTLSVDEELALTALTGEEEELAKDALLHGGAWAAVDQPVLFRLCKVGATHRGILGLYDTDGDGQISTGEEPGVWQARVDRDECERERRVRVWRTLTLVYDDDASGVLESAERERLFADFTERCENRHAILLADFDTNGDGAIGDDELRPIHDQISEHRASRGEMCREERRPAGTWVGGHSEHRRLGPESQWDSNGDGDLDDAEREGVKALIRSGALLFERPHPPMGGAEDGRH